MDENMFDLGLDAATISADLPDPVITLSSADSYTVQDTADYPLLALNVYGKSVQDETPTSDTPIDIVSVGDDGAVEVVACGKNFFDSPLVYGTYAEEGVIVDVTNAVRTTKRIYLEAGTYTISSQNVKRGVGYKFTNATITTGTQIFPWTNESNIPKTFTLAENAYCVFAFNNVPVTGNVVLKDVTDLQIEKSSAATEYKPYAGNTATIISGLPLCSVGDVRDELVYNADGTRKIIKRTAKIDSYNGETITTSYISSTGGLDTGAEVVYVLENPIEIELSAAEMAELQKLQSYEGTTNIYNYEQAEMLVKMLRSDYDMKYIEWLKEPQTWTCPKAGKWKVICVGGGASGGIYEKATGSGATEQALIATVAGGTTSFGSIIAADGAPSTSDYTTHGYSSEVVGVSGYGGYTGVDYGGTPSIGNSTLRQEFGAAVGNKNAGMYAIANPTAALGYGAGGGAVGRLKTSYDVSPIPGRAGSIESTIVDLDEGQTIMCTVGKGGQTTDATFMGSGADGVIVVQYLGY